MRGALASRRGQSLIEFSLVLVLLLTLTFGIIAFGVLLYDQQVITNASREGARKGIVARIPRYPVEGADSIHSAVNDYCLGRLITFGTQNVPSVTVSGHDANAAFGTPLTVTVEYDYTFLFWGTAAKHMVARTVMNYE